MPEKTFHLILASGSPRRRELLTRMGYTFDIIVPNVDENAEGPARDIVAVLSRRKAQAVFDEIAGRPDRYIVIASDTLVSLDGISLGKPADTADAVRMLSMLSGRAHEVYSGVTIMDTADGRSETRSVCTRIHFRELSEAEIAGYAATGEPLDKAGAYAIQGGAAGFVDHLEGSYENVVGFPVSDIREMLAHFGISGQEA